MAHFALICPPFYSHIKVFEALAATLRKRGHDATFVLNAGGEVMLSRGERRWRTVSPGSAGDLGFILRRAARPNGPLGILQTVADTARLSDALCRGAPAILREIGANAVIGDQMEPAASLVAAHLGLPLVSLACALPISTTPDIPPPYLSWRYRAGALGRWRNHGGETIAALLLLRQRRAIEAWSKRFGLPKRSTLDACLSPLLQISQTVESFDFPRAARAGFNAVGPIRSRASADEPLPFPIDPERPFVFASFGTLQGHRLGLFRTIAKACRRLDVQLLVAHCGALTEAEAASINANHVASFVPQAAVLAKADICITHAGLNTVLDALEAGVPLLAIPIAFDQPGVAARIVHHRVGLSRSRVLLSSAKVEASLAALLDASTYRDNARRIGQDIAASGGAERATQLIEDAMTGKRETAA
ncbi:MAG: glycosyltransferase family 1 protein [Rhizobiaceae bacterium]|nr:glycosyltransferase family 1 protein [Rhizobiaceae bacterium]